MSDIANGRKNYRAYLLASTLSAGGDGTAVFSELAGQCDAADEGSILHREPDSEQERTIENERLDAYNEALRA